MNGNTVIEPINPDRIRAWVDRFNGYRQTVTDRRIREWLRNFEDNTELGAKVLDEVDFFTSEEMETALREMATRLPGWNKYKTKSEGRWRFVAFSLSEGESGGTMLHKFRTALGLTSSRYHGLFIHMSDLVREELGPEDNVVFLDDFAGTGRQACNAWPTFSELLTGNPNVFLILIAAARRAAQRINKETGLKVIASRLLGPRDDVFSPKCKRFTQSEKRGLYRYCEQASPERPRGYGNCGFLIVLAHKTPNNSIPILHVNNQNWTGIFPRQ